VINDLMMTPDNFEYLIRKTITYLEFHSDDSAKELAAQWQQLLSQMQKSKKNSQK
jgi:predicted transcriptional regulator YdeE